MKYKIILPVLVVLILAAGAALILAKKNKKETTVIQQSGKNLPNQVAEPPPPKVTDNIQINPPVQQSGNANPASPTTATTQTPHTTEPTPAPTPEPTPTPQPTPAPTQQPAPTPKTDNLSATADDSAATPDTLTVSKGDTVNLTLNVKTTGVYYGGLDFRSSVVNSGTVLPGKNKTVTFTATQSFDIHCFWPSSNVEKAAVIHIVVN